MYTSFWFCYTSDQNVIRLLAIFIVNYKLGSKVCKRPCKCSKGIRSEKAYALLVAVVVDGNLLGKRRISQNYALEWRENKRKKKVLVLRLLWSGLVLALFPIAITGLPRVFKYLKLVQKRKVLHIQRLSVRMYLDIWIEFRYTRCTESCAVLSNLILFHIELRREVYVCCCLGVVQGDCFWPCKYHILGWILGERKQLIYIGRVGVIYNGAKGERG